MDMMGDGWGVETICQHIGEEYEFQGAETGVDARSNASARGRKSQENKTGGIKQQPEHHLLQMPLQMHFAKHPHAPSDSKQRAEVCYRPTYGHRDMDHRHGSGDLACRPDGAGGLRQKKLPAVWERWNQPFMQHSVYNRRR